MKVDRNDGFTLIELLIVAFILAIIAGGAVLILSDQQEDASLKISHKEILDIKKAVLQFKRDTGFLPKQGPFALDIDCTSPDNLSERRFCSPANFEQLYEAPDIPAGDPLEHLENWNPDTARGWRGPYLTRFGEGVVDIGDDINPDKNGDSGNPEQGTLLLDIRGVSDAFIAFRSVCPTNEKECYLGFSTLPDDETHQKWGRPYLMFGLETASTDDDRIVGMGPNKTYNQES